MVEDKKRYGIEHTGAQLPASDTSTSQKNSSSTQDAGSGYFQSNASIWNTGSIVNNVAKDVNYNYYSESWEAAPRLKLLQRICSRAMFNGDVRADAPRCHPETRRSIVSDIKPWVTDIYSASYILWLKGPVGTGKSAIARRVCEEFHEEDPRLLAGSFFFWRHDNDRNSLKRFAPTIAYRILVVMPEAGRIIEEVILQDPSVLDMTPEYQWNALVVKPLYRVLSMVVTPSQRSLIVIDGLDECDTPSSQRQLLYLLTSFSRHRGLAQYIAFLICSRPESHIESEMDLLASESPSHFRPHLMLCENEESRDDMRLILTLSFNHISRRRRSVIRGQQWPPEGTIDRIIYLANGQFIYTLTIIRWLEEDDGHPIHRLNCIFDAPCDEKTRALAPLDKLYNLILSSACSKPAGDLVVPSLFFITGRSLWHIQMLELRKLSGLFEKDCDYLRLVLQPLHSVLRMPEEDRGFIDIYHTSFIEYLRDRSRSGIYYVLGGTVLSFVLSKALKWASVDCEPEEQRLTSWLQIPLPEVIVNRQLVDALTQLDARKWLQERLLWLQNGINIRGIHQKYTVFRQWIIYSAPEGHQQVILRNYPEDLFPTNNTSYMRAYAWHLLCNWVEDFRSRMLTPRETILMLSALFAFAMEKYDPVQSTGKQSQWTLYQDRLERISCYSRMACLLPIEVHNCMTQKVLHYELEALHFMNKYNWERFMTAILPYPFSQYPTRALPTAGTEIIESMFTPLDVLCILSASDSLDRSLFLRCIKIIRETQMTISISRRTLIVLRGVVKWSSGVEHFHEHLDVRDDILWLIEQFGDVTPVPLLTHWRNLECLPIPDSASIVGLSAVDEVLTEYQMGGCKCDEILHFQSKSLSRPPKQVYNRNMPGAKPILKTKDKRILRSLRQSLSTEVAEKSRNQSQHC
ncbi:hypothetical protein AX16_003836 [Volvariella volvacea WC 439]|nr:hypothetical protein AX16_003836 [Volvariella volvacea WC 439]